MTLVGYINAERFEEEILVEYSVKAIVRELVYRLDKLSEELTDFTQTTAFVIDTELKVVVVRLMQFTAVTVLAGDSDKEGYFHGIKYTVEPDILEETKIFGEWEFDK